jgi:hypothetical protein
MVLKIDTSTPEGKTVYPSEAIEKAINGLKDGSKIAITRIKEAKKGTGYAFFTDSFYCEQNEEHYEVMDFCWKNSKLGKTIAAVFEETDLLDNTAILLIIQQKLKSAVILSMESPGSRWEVDELGELVFFYGDMVGVSIAPLDQASVDQSPSSASVLTESGSPNKPPKQKAS